MTKSSGLEKKQSDERAETIRKIDVAIENLIHANIKPTKAAIAREAELHEQTMYKPHVREHLATHPLLGRRKAVDSTWDLEKALARIALLEDEVQNNMQRKKQLHLELKELRTKYNELEHKYRRVLGEFQLKHENDLILF